jgi:acyl-CoA synthetase (AMP-forming)/AMP-acid ligase II
VHGRHRLDHRSFLYRLWTVGARRLVGGIRGASHLSRRGASMAYRRRTRRQYLSHIANSDPRASPRRAINVAGHRLGTKEIESASLLVEEVAEAAVIPARDEIKGKVPDLYVSPKPGRQPSEEVRKRVESSVVREIGPIARPRRVVIVPDMPKTRRITRTPAISRPWPILKSSMRFER